MNRHTNHIKHLPELCFTVKQWSKFAIPMQEHLLTKFDVILTNHRTRRERFIGIIENIDITSRKGRKNLNIAIQKMDNGFKTFDKYNRSIFGDDSPKRYHAITGKKSF